MKRLLLYIAAMMLSLSSYSQRVNISSSVGANLFGGNWDSYLINSQFSIAQDSTDITWGVSPNFSFGQVKKSDGLWYTNQREFYVNANATRKWNRHRGLMFGEAENSYLKRIQFRGALGIGYGYDVIKREKITLLISESYLLEKYLAEDVSNKNLTSIRLSTRIKFEYKGKLKFTSITLFQPAISSAPPVNFSDNINLRINNLIEYPISKQLSIGLQLNGYLSTYSTYVDSNVKPFDYSSLLVFKYKNF